MLFTLEYDTDPQKALWEPDILWDPDINDVGAYRGHNVYNIQLKKQINHADSLSFTIPMGHPAYSHFYATKALGITVGLRESGSDIFTFFGRAVSIESDDYGGKNVTCEGAFAFLNDILLRPATFAQYEGSYGKDLINNTKNWEDYLRFVMTKFYNRMGSAQNGGNCQKRVMSLDLHGKMIYTAQDPTGIDVTEGKLYSGINDYMPVIDAINDLIGVDPRIIAYTRSNINSGTHTVATYLTIGTGLSDNPNAVMALDKNVISISPSANAFDMYTAIIPLDKNKLCRDTTVTTSDIRYHKDESDVTFRAADTLINGMNGIGYIEKVVNLDEYELYPEESTDEDQIAVRNKFDNRARQILDTCNARAVSEYSVSMVDLSLLNCVEREVFLVQNDVDSMYPDYTIRTITDLDTQKYESSLSIVPGLVGTHIAEEGECVLYGMHMYQYLPFVEDGQNVLKWEKVTNPIYIPRTTTPISIDPYRNPVRIDLELVEAETDDLVVFEDYVYKFNGTSWAKYKSAKNLYFKNQNGVYDYISDFSTIDIGQRVHFTCPEYGIVDDKYSPWVCTSLSMQIDDQGASSYTFSLVDSTFVPPDNSLLSDWSRAISGNGGRNNHIQKATNSANYKSEAQPISVVKVDDNHVIEFYTDREVHYVAEGEGDVRNYINSYEMPFGTTDPLDPFPDTNDND